MKSLLKNLLVSFALLLSGCGGNFAYAQSQNTVYETLATDVTASANYGPVTNIGQTFHLASVVTGNVPTKTCMGATQVDIIFRGGYTPTFSDSVILIQTKYNTGNTGIVQSQASGAYPFIWIVATSQDPVNCNYTLTYSGSLSSSIPSRDQVIGQEALTTTISGAFGTGDLITGGGSTTTYNNIYRLHISSDMATTVTLSCGMATTLDVFYIGANIPFVLPYSPAIYYSCNDMNNVSFTYTTLGAAIQVSALYNINVVQY